MKNSILRQTLKEVVEEIDKRFAKVQLSLGCDWDKGCPIELINLRKEIKQLLLSKFGEELIK